MHLECGRIKHTESQKYFLLYILHTFDVYSDKVYHQFSQVPSIVAQDITTNENNGTCFVTVQLVNEIERHFVVRYATEELPWPDEASGMYVANIYFSYNVCCIYYVIGGNDFVEKT